MVKMKIYKNIEEMEIGKDIVLEETYKKTIAKINQKIWQNELNRKKEVKKKDG